jgi:hypothetical protein
MAFIGRNMRKPAHTGAADADKMNLFNFIKVKRQVIHHR